jgi:phage head maturation protease
MKIINSIEDLKKCHKGDQFEKRPLKVHDATLIGDWQETKDIPAETLRKWTNDPDKLDGLILKGYEMKWEKTNENGERYEKTAFDSFIQSYFVEGGLNMTVDVNHEGYHDWQAICGRVLYVETNSVGFYFVVYVPRVFERYEQLKWRLQEGIIQGFSKEGWATDWDVKWKEDGTFDYELIKEMKVTSVSLVSIPANGFEFEKMQEIKNALIFNSKNEKKQGKEFADLFK